MLCAVESDESVLVSSDDAVDVFDSFDISSAETSSIDDSEVAFGFTWSLLAPVASSKESPC